MKKRIFYVLSSLLIFTAPSMVQAEEFGSVPNPNSKSTNQSLLGIHTITKLVDGLGSLLGQNSGPTQAVEPVTQADAAPEALLEAPPVEETVTSTVDTVDVTTQVVESVDSTEQNVVSEPVIQNASPVQSNNVETAPVKTNQKPLLSIGLLGLNINLLGGNSNTGTSLLSIDASENVLQPSSGLLSVGLGLGPVGNVGLDLLSAQNAQADNGEATSKSGLLGLTVTDSALLGNLNVDLLSAESAQADNGESTSKSGLLGLGLTDSALLGNLNVGLLSNTKTLTENGFSTNSGLATVDLDNLLINTHVGVLESGKTVSGDTTTFTSSIVSAGVRAPLIGELHTGIGEISGLISPDRTEFHSGLVVADIKNDILGNQHVGVVEYHEVVTDEGKTTSGGLVIVDVNDSPVGDIHVGVGEFETPGDNVIPPIIIIPGKPGTPENPKTETPGTPDKENPGKGNGDNNSGNQDDPKGPSTPVTDGGKGTSGDNQTPNTEDKTTDENGSEQQNSSEETNPANNESLDLLDVINSPVGEFLQKLLDAGNQTILNQGVDQSAQFGLEIEKVIKKSAESTGITTAVSAPSASSSGSSSGSTTLSGGSGTFADLISGYNLEESIEKETNSVLKTLSTQWTEPPPVQPPIAPFFLAR